MALPHAALGVAFAMVQKLYWLECNRSLDQLTEIPYALAQAQILVSTLVSEEYVTEL